MLVCFMVCFNVGESWVELGVENGFVIMVML